MTLFADPSFFVLLAVAVAGAAAIGLSGHTLRHYGLAVSVGFLACVFFKTPAQLAALLAFVAVARAAVLFLARDPKDKRRYLVAVASTLAPLVVYKVSAVFDQSIWGFVGISYVTFKATQVVIEVHDGLIARDELGLEDWLYFLLFFPQFSSGPIDRSRRFAADAHATPSRDEYAGMLARGILLLLAGAVYKVVVATWIHRFYAPSATGDALQQLQTALLYGLYLFCDFQGYSLMAMGASYCLGIRCPRNFRAPFAAVDIIDFWNRWHITLSTWFRDFVFMRFTRWVMHRKLLHDRLQVAMCAFMVDMLVMGFWHGIAWCYIGYGIYHGVLLAVTQAMQKRWGFYKKHRRDCWFRACSWAVTQALVFLGFAIFSGQVGTLLG
ncbi:D-alanyl-lipoteichoic acid biosynthesis protein DltB [Paratractidigestivibacter sp.]|uniref:D-alanyl-lipoteichoic acid biosynthesis protein DltB n=1 Tax=Paratractidigestivibacter sp. TaxID=2847316 RepID=UPI003A939D01